MNYLNIWERMGQVRACWRMADRDADGEGENKAYFYVRWFIPSSKIDFATSLGAAVLACLLLIFTQHSVWRPGRFWLMLSGFPLCIGSSNIAHYLLAKLRPPVIE